MNQNDLMNALSGLDPKYIDEAAFELKEKEADTKKAKIISLKKGLFVAVPAAAAILLTATVLLSGLMRSNKSDASYAPAESAAESVAEEAMPAADEEYAEEAADYTEEAEEGSYGEVNAEDAAPEAEASDSAGGASDTYGPGENAAEAPETFAPSNALTGDSAKKDRGNDVINPVSASYEEGIVTVIIVGTLPEDFEETEYIITAKGDDASSIIISKGMIGDILESRDPLKLNVKDQNLAKGTYTLFLAGENIDFEVK